MTSVFIIHLDWNVHGDTGHEIIGTAYESYRDACFHLAELVKADLQYLDWLEQCNEFYMRDMDGKEVSENTPVPDFIAAFCAQDTKDSPEYMEQYWIEELTVIPESTDSQIEESNGKPVQYS